MKEDGDHESRLWPDRADRSITWLADDLLAKDKALSGGPDVIFFNAALSRLYVAIGDPGVIDVFDTTPLQRHETIVTEAGAHALAFDPARSIVCAFLPATCRAAVYEDR